jgi:hypothetical protein
LWHGSTVAANDDIIKNHSQRLLYHWKQAAVKTGGLSKPGFKLSLSSGPENHNPSAASGMSGKLAHDFQSGIDLTPINLPRAPEPFVPRSVHQKQLCLLSLEQVGCEI